MNRHDSLTPKRMNMHRFHITFKNKIMYIMKSNIFLCFVLLCCFGISRKAEAQNIISDLETPKEGEGTIRIVCAAKIINMLGTPTLAAPPEVIDETINMAKLTGYRIQIYMDNSQRARTEAARIAGLMNETFPEVATYVRYYAPNWKVLVGDFHTKEEAESFKQVIHRYLPELQKEMYIIASKINFSAPK
jgi:hypothetical protein